MAGPGTDDDADDKPFEATQKRLDDARKKGEVPHSADLTGAAATGGLLLAAVAFGRETLTGLATALAALVERAGPISEAWLNGPAAAATGPLYLALAGQTALWFGLPALVALAAVLAQRAFVISAEKIKPQLGRISPIAGAKNKFGRNGLFEFAKSTVKLVLVSAILGLFLASRLPAILATPALDPAQVTGRMLRLAVDFLSIVFLTMLCLGGVDFLWQRAEHLRKNRMSRKELQDETKDSEGDAWLKSRRRDKGVEIALNRMMADVPGADVVIVNPVHYAVALRWDRGAGGAPVCVAKGVDEVALRIRRVAMEAGVPIRHDPPTARALHGMVEIGAEIAPEHYRAVAVAIRFADRVRARARRGGADGS